LHLFRARTKFQLLQQTHVNPIFCGKLSSALLPGLFALSFLSSADLSTRTYAQSNPALPISLSHRYLLIVETSRTMNHRWQGVSAAIQEFLDSGIKPESRPGDTLRIWTFNGDLQTNSFSQVELPLGAPPGFGNQLINFVQAQPSSSRAALEKVFPGVNQLIKETDFATVVLITAGESELRGTPFDGQVNQSFRRWQEEQKKARMPFVTVLRAAHGKFTHCSVTPAQWPLELPPFPMELRFVPAKPAPVPVGVPKMPKETTPPQWTTATTATYQAAAFKATEQSATAVAAAPKPMLEGKLSPAHNAQPTQSAKPAAPIAQSNSPKPAKPQKAPATNSFAGSLSPNWQPFDTSVPNWLALESLPVAPAAALPETQPQALKAEPRKPTLVVNALESKPSETAPEAVKPFDGELADWLASAAAPPIHPPSAKFVTETAEARKAETASTPSAFPKPEEQANPAGTQATIFIVEAQSVPKNPVPEASHVARKSPIPADSPESKSKTTLPPSTPQVLLAPKEAEITKTRARAEVAPVSQFATPAASIPAAPVHSPVASQDVPTRSAVPTAIALAADTTDIAVKLAEAKGKEFRLPVTATVVHPRPNFFRENGGLLAASLLAAAAAVFCFVNWLRSFLWPRRNRPAIPGAAFALLPPPRTEKEEENRIPTETETSFPPIDLPFDLPPLRKPKRLDPLVISETARR
jgi:hypothetical protein